MRFNRTDDFAPAPLGGPRVTYTLLDYPDNPFIITITRAGIQVIANTVFFTDDSGFAEIIQWSHYQYCCIRDNGRAIPSNILDKALGVF